MKIEGRMTLVNSEEGLSKEVSIQRIKDIVKPLTRLQRVKRAFRQLNEPIVWPSST